MIEAAAESEAPAKTAQVSGRMFGELDYAAMHENPELARYAMKVVKEACDARKRDPDVSAVAEGLVSGRFKLWGVMGANAALDAVAVTERKDTTMEIVLVGPRVEDFAEFLPMLEKFARGLRCTRLVMGGPPIFKRLLPDGWTSRTEIRYERALT